MDEKQAKIWLKNFRQGYRFFQPQHAPETIPRTLREAEIQMAKKRKKT